MAQLPSEVVGSLPLEMVLESHGDVALRSMVSGHVGLGLDLGILEDFSNLNDSMIL